MLPMIAAMFLLMPVQNPGGASAPLPMKHFLLFSIIWIFTMLASLFMYGFALRWALKVKWSDFRIVAVAAGSDAGEIHK